MTRDGLIFDVRGNSGGHTSELVVEKLARQVQPSRALPRVADGPGKSRRPLPPRPGSLAASDAGAR
jgi:C-terminal processing protease CtpA/Prc